MFDYTTRSCVFQTGTQVHIQDTGSYSPSSWLYWQLIPDDSQLSLSLSFGWDSWICFFYTVPLFLPPKIQISRTVSSYTFPTSLCLHTYVPEKLAYCVLEKCYWIICWGNSKYRFGFYIHYWDDKYINTSTGKLHRVWTLYIFIILYLLCVCICMHVPWITYGGPRTICEVRFLL